MRRAGNVLRVILRAATGFAAAAPSVPEDVNVEVARPANPQRLDEGLEEVDAAHPAWRVISPAQREIADSLGIQPLAHGTTDGAMYALGGVYTCGALLLAAG